MNLTQLETNYEEIKVMLESGIVLREAGRLDEAENIFQGLIELAPHSEIPLVALSTVESQQKNFAEAFELCQKAQFLNPESSFTKINLAEILLFQKEYDLAKKILQEIIQRDSHSPHGKRAETLLDVIGKSFDDISI